jgi:hypothetical protein
MKMKILVPFIILAALISAGCGKNCRDVGCAAAPPAFFAFRITNNANKDLLTGAFKQFDSTQLQIKARRNNSSTLETVQRVFNFYGDTLALTGFTVNKSYATYYLQLNGAISDTLVFNFNERIDNCCDLSFYSLGKVNTATVSGYNLPNTYVFKK